jgi:folylpolyglutamate synthase/dihydropteroate synthase
MLRGFPYNKIILCGFDNPRAADIIELKNKLALLDARLAVDIARAYEIAKEYYDKNSVILIAGSFFLVTEAMRIVPKMPKVRSVFRQGRTRLYR